jgi:hypothetical protein
MQIQFRVRTLSCQTAVLAAGLMLAVAGCSHVTPIGPDPAARTPASRHLGSPITFRAMRSQPATPTGKCPAGYALLDDAGSGGTCYSNLGAPVTITSAGISPVSAQGQPPSYAFGVTVPAGDVAALTAVIKQAYDVRGALAVDVEGKVWSAPEVLAAFSAQQLQIALPTKGEALELYRILVDEPQAAGANPSNVASRRYDNRQMPVPRMRDKVATLQSPGLRAREPADPALALARGGGHAG